MFFAASLSYDAAVLCCRLTIQVSVVQERSCRDELLPYAWCSPLLHAALRLRLSIFALRPGLRIRPATGDSTPLTSPRPARPPTPSSNSPWAAGVKVSAFRPR